jgi:arylsulfatase A-like enzyme
MIDFIDTRGLAEKTLVIFTADHGSMLYDHGIPNDKHTFLGASWRVPLILRMPGTLPAGAVARFASTLDVTATVLGAAGVTAPASAQYGDGATNTSFFMAGFDLCVVSSFVRRAERSYSQTRRWKRR